MHLSQSPQIKVSLLFFLMVLFACAKKSESIKEDGFVLTDSLVNTLLIDTVKQSENKTDLTFSAKITADEDRKSEIFPMVSGIVGNVVVKLGDKVRSGQTLAIINSSEMAGFDKEVVAAGAEFKTAERNLKQAEQLFEAGLSSAKEIEEARNEYEVKKAELKRSNAVFNLNGGNNSGKFAIKSPINGFIIEKHITNNMSLRGDNDKSLFTIADLSNIWALINVYESDISNIKEGDRVELNTLSYPDKIFKGKIDKLYDLIDQESKVMHARVNIANPDVLLKPGMLGTVAVSSNLGTNLPVVSSKAVLFDDNKNYVLIVDSSNKIKIQEIAISRKVGDKAFVNKGLKVGDRVVISKQVYLFENLKNK